MEVAPGPITDEQAATAWQIHTVDWCSAVGGDGAPTGPWGRGPGAVCRRGAGSPLAGRVHRRASGSGSVDASCERRACGGEQAGGLGAGGGDGSDC